jgi:uncharacterized protein (TIGR02391 family)
MYGLTPRAADASPAGSAPLTHPLARMVRKEDDMPLLTLDWDSDDLVDRYASFVSSLMWFRMYCTGHFGNGIQDYRDGFQSLKGNYEYLWDMDEQIPEEWKIKPVVKLMDSLEAILKSKRLTDSQISQIATLIWEFQQNHEREFRTVYVKEQVVYDHRQQYPAALYDAIVDLLDHENTDEAVVTAFKFLDNHIQKLTGMSYHQMYGEELINSAFAPKSGALQIGTDPNEQVGLRNLFSGANAVFRNPAAHRFVKNNLFFTTCIIAMVSAMAEIASQISSNRSSMSAG